MALVALAGLMAAGIHGTVFAALPGAREVGEAPDLMALLLRGLAAATGIVHMLLA